MTVNAPTVNKKCKITTDQRPLYFLLVLEDIRFLPNLIIFGQEKIPCIFRRPCDHEYVNYFNTLSFRFFNYFIYFNIYTFNVCV